MTESLTSISLAVVLAIGLAACTVGPDYQPPSIDAPGDWAEAAHLKDADRSGDAQERLAGWWRAFGDETLNELVREAIAGNHELKMARSRIIAARADRAIAAAQGEPQLGFSAQAARSRASKALTLNPVGGVANQFLAGFDASWEIDLFGKNRRTVEAADAAVDAAVEDRRAVLVSLLGELGTDYAALRSAQERIEISRRTIEADRDALDMAQQKFVHGLGSELDVAQAQAELEQVRAGIPQFETEVARYAHAIAVLLGKEPGALADLTAMSGAMPPAPTSLPLTIPSQVVRNRPDIREAERVLASANAEIGVAVANQFPSFTLSPSLGVEAGQLNKLLTGKGVTWGASAGVDQPIFEGGALEAAVEKAKAVTEEDRLIYERTVLRAFAEVEDAMVALGNERRRHDTLQRAVTANRTALQRSRELYQGGLAPFINVVNSERNLNSAEDSLAQSREIVIAQTVALYKALGGGWQSLEETPEPVVK